MLYLSKICAHYEQPMPEAGCPRIVQAATAASHHQGHGTAGHLLLLGSWSRADRDVPCSSV